MTKSRARTHTKIVKDQFVWPFTILTNNTSCLLLPFSLHISLYEMQHWWQLACGRSVRADHRKYTCPNTTLQPEPELTPDMSKWCCDGEETKREGVTGTDWARRRRTFRIFPDDNGDLQLICICNLLIITVHCRYAWDELLIKNIINEHKKVLK